MNFAFSTSVRDQTTSVRTFSEKANALSRRIAWTFAAVLAFSPLATPGSDALWTAHVEPLLKEHCAECHNPTKAKSGLDVSSLQTLLRGGDRGTAVVAGRPDESNLYKFLSAEADIHMPPGKRERLSEEESGLIRKWIQEMKVGNPPALAEGPKDELATPSAIAKPRITWEPPSDMPPARTVDRFLSLAWKLDKVEPAKGIDDAAFARRVYLDLLGRIPNSQELTDFAGDRSRDKRAQLIERLLASGEYARHMREIFDSVLMERRGGEWENRRNDQKWFAFLEDAFARNRPWNEVVRDLIVARPAQTDDRGAVWYLFERQNNAQAIAEGSRRSCSACR